MINNAGVAVGTGIELSSLELFKANLAVNIEGYARVAKQFLPLLRKAEGRLVNIGSISSQTGFVYGGGYSASKVIDKKIYVYLLISSFTHQAFNSLITKTDYFIAC